MLIDVFDTMDYDDKRLINSILTILNNDDNKITFRNYWVDVETDNLKIIFEISACDDDIEINDITIEVYKIVKVKKFLRPSVSRKVIVNTYMFKCSDYDFGKLNVVVSKMISCNLQEEKAKKEEAKKEELRKAVKALERL